AGEEPVTVVPLLDQNRFRGGAAAVCGEDGADRLVHEGFSPKGRGGAEGRGAGATRARSPGGGLFLHRGGGSANGTRMGATGGGGKGLGPGEVHGWETDRKHRFSGRRTFRPPDNVYPYGRRVNNQLGHRGRRSRRHGGGSSLRDRITARCTRRGIAGTGGAVD